MTQLLQSGQHPDADQLSAFAEHALPPHEQHQTLAHLAECANCRAIVFLAQQPDLAAAARPQPDAVRRPWFSGWNLALPAAFALAALVLVTIHLHKSSADQSQAAGNNTAHLEQPAQTPPAVSAKPIPAPIVKGQFTPHLAARIAAPPPARLQAQPPLLQSSSDGHVSYAAVQPAGMAGTGVGVGDQAKTPVAGAVPSLNGMAATAAPQQAALGGMGSTRREFRSSASQYNAPLPAAAAPARSSLNEAYMEALPAPPVSPPPAKANQTVMVTTASDAVDVDSNASSQVVENEVYSSLPLATLKAKKQPSLPSHLPPVSTVSNARQVLAIDTAGTLFRSNDAGVTWQPVSAQWPGRAIKLQLMPPPDVHQLARATDSAAAISAGKTAPPEPTHTAFELTTDAGQVWISTDGQTWKRK